MAAPLHSLERGLEEITVGSRRAEIAYRKMLAQTAGAEYHQHIKVPVSGNVGHQPIEIEQTVTFPLPFMYAPNQSPNSMPVPHFNSGLEVPQSQRVRPVLDPHLVRWILSDECRYTGCVIRITAYIPYAPRITRFQAQLHLTFYGWAAPLEEVDENTDA